MMTYPLSSIGGKRGRFQLLLLVFLAGVAILAGGDFARHIPQFETWVVSHGWMGPAVFLIAVVVLASIFVPDTLLAAAAGALFGVVGGTLIMVAAAFITAALDFAISRSFLHKFVSKLLAARPRIAAIHKAVATEGLRFQFLLRLTPINPVLLNYALGTSKTPFSTFFLACAGMIPAIAVEVYFGHAAKHVACVAGGVSNHSAMQTGITIVGLAACFAVLIYVTRVARRALAAYETVAIPRREAEPA